MSKPTVALIILDGLGIAPNSKGNAVSLANMPFYNSILNNYPTTQIQASAEAVGLSAGQMGNSEVGHSNLGAGRVIYQDSMLITKQIQTGEFFTNKAFMQAVKNCKDHNSALHLIGLCSNGGVHSQLTHLFALVDLALKNNLTKVYIHAITDGRDVPPQSAKQFLNELQLKLNNTPNYKIATITGRYNIMDRDNKWDRVQKGYDAIIMGIGANYINYENAIEDSYNNGVTDEFIEPIILNNYKGANENDSLIFFNYRTDRAREIARAITVKDFNGFNRKKVLTNFCYVCMTQCDKTLTNCLVAYPPQTPKNMLGEYLSNIGLTQARIAETEKYAHVTFFFNGGVEVPYKNEQRYLINSPKVATFDLKPEMSAYEVTDTALKVLDDGIDVLILNYANPDMVGHTGSIPATIKALEAVDECLKKLVNKILQIGGSAIVTADHGNSECMLLNDGSPCTSHTCNPVNIIIVSNKIKNIKLKQDGKLANVAPTMLDIMGVKKPAEMEEDSLIIK